MVSMAAADKRDREIVAAVGITPKKAAQWRARDIRKGLAGLAKDTPQPGPLTLARAGIGAICRALPRTDRSSYEIIYSRILEAGGDACIPLIPSVGTGRFELLLPCAQGMRAGGWPRDPFTNTAFRYPPPGGVDSS
jgi:hypothetical protein